MAAELQDPATVRIDPVTLAALQDTGWYRVELSRAQSLLWGDGKRRGGVVRIICWITNITFNKTRDYKGTTIDV